MDIIICNICSCPYETIHTEVSVCRLRFKKSRFAALSLPWSNMSGMASPNHYKSDCSFHNLLGLVTKGTNSKALYSWDFNTLFRRIALCGIVIIVSSHERNAYQITEKSTVYYTACLIEEQKEHHISALLGLRDWNHWLLDSVSKIIACLTTKKTTKPSHGRRSQVGLFFYINIYQDITKICAWVCNLRNCVLRHCYNSNITWAS